MPRKPDQAHEWTDKEIARFERRARSEYRKAAMEMREKQEAFLADYGRRRDAFMRAHREGKVSSEDVRKWRSREAALSARLSDMVDQLSASASAANARAMNAANGLVASVYAENIAWGAYEVERAAKVGTPFSLVSSEAVEHLIRSGVRNTPIIPEVPNRLAVNKARDIAWNRRKFTSAVTQGILQGESVPHIVRRTTSIYNSNMSAAFRAVRTACTSAQNAGRQASFERAEAMGIKLNKRWMATKDAHTRDSHKALDGQEVPTKEPFDSEHGPIDYPGDPAADPAEVWNCRCTMTSVQVEDSSGLPRDASAASMGFAEWVSMAATVAAIVGSGQDAIGAAAHNARNGEWLEEAYE